MRLKKWLGISETKPKKKKEQLSGPDAYRQELRRRRRKLRANGRHVEPETREVDDLRKRLDELSQELREINRGNQEFSRQQISMMRKENRRDKVKNATTVFRRGMEAMAAKPMPKDEMRKRMFSNEYWNRTAPPRRKPPTRVSR